MERLSGASNRGKFIVSIFMPAKIHLPAASGSVDGLFNSGA